MPANKERYPGVERCRDDRYVHLNGTCVLTGPHDHFLRFDHFLRLKNDAFDEHQMGHLENVSKGRELEAIPFPSSSLSRSPAISTPLFAPVIPTSSRKRHRRSSISSSSESAASTLDFVENVTPKAVDDIGIAGAPVLGLIPASDSSKDPNASATTVSDLQPRFSPLSVWNVQALTLSLRPYLLSRNEGSLFIKQIIRKDEGRSAVAIRICNTGDKCIDLSGWRLFAMGNPSQVDSEKLVYCDRERI